MAKSSKSVSFKNAVISKDDMTITEYTKDETMVYDLEKILSEWNGVEPVSLTIKQEVTIPTDE